MPLDAQILRYFVQVAELGSLTVAARALNIAQPALSQRMANLEDHLGVQLLLRSSRGVQLTPDGHRLLVHARDLLERFRVIEQEMGRGADVLRGTVTVGMPAPAANVLLIPLVERIAAQYPGLHLRIEENRSISLVDGLLAGHFDLIVGAHEGESGRIEAEPLVQESLHLIGAAGYGLPETVRFEELFDRPLIVSSQIDPQRSVMAKVAERLNGSLDIVLESTSLPTTKRMLVAGGRFAIMTWSAVAEEVVDGKLAAARIIDPDLPRPLYLCQLRDRRHSVAVQAVAEALRSIAGELTERRTFR